MLRVALVTFTFCLTMTGCLPATQTHEKTDKTPTNPPPAVGQVSPPALNPEEFRDPESSLNQFFSQSIEDIKKAPDYKRLTMFKLAMQVGDFPLSDPDNVIRRMDVILQFAPENRAAVIYRASALVRKGRTEEALKALEPIRAKLNELPLALVMRLVDVLLRANALAEAEKDLRATEKRAPNFVEARFLLSRVIYAQGRIDEAEARLKEDLKIFPKYAGGMILLGEISEKKGNLKDAEEYYLQAEPFIQDSPLVAEKLTRLYVKMGKKERAKVFLKKYREHRAANPRIVAELSQLVK